MASFSLQDDKADAPKSGARGPLLVVEGLDVYYGRAHALQGVSFTLPRGVLGIVGRNGMGKTTLCNAICGLVPARGSVRLAAKILGLAGPLDQRAASPTCPRAPRLPSLGVEETRAGGAQPRDNRSRLRDVPAPGRVAGARRRPGSRAASSICSDRPSPAARPRLLVMDEPPRAGAGCRGRLALGISRASTRSRCC